MTLKLAINGFGRIGRNVLRALMDQPAMGLDVVAINDLAPLETCAHLYAFDSVHGRAAQPVTLGDGTLDLGRGPIRVTAEPDPAKLPWHDVDIAIEATAVFCAPEDTARHLENGSARVLLAAPAKGEMKTIVYGINHETITAADRMISNGSCTTNCLVPVTKVIDDAFGVLRGHMTTVHCYTGSQKVHDTAHRDLYRARAANLSMVPTTTGAAETLGLVLPHLASKITGTAIRVPTPNVSCCDLVVETKTPMRADEVTAAMQSAAHGPMKGILEVEPRKLVSMDYNHTAASAIYAADQTSVQQGSLLRVLAWYDNEWAFSNRLLDVARAMGRTT
ncbi:MAG: type I glyceraldehyde-3-phosphate dehydrogenase [Pseudomonadota bacterium]